MLSTTSAFTKPVNLNMASAKRTIRFANDLCLYHDGAVLDNSYATVNDLWYHHDELKQMKKSDVERSEDQGCQGFCSLLTNTYGKNNKATRSAIIEWCLTCSSRRGLERYVNYDYSVRRSDSRHRTVSGVLKAQRQMQRDNTNHTEYAITLLGRVSQAFSEDAAGFAGMLGAADEMAATDCRKGNEPTCCPNGLLQSPTAEAPTMSLKPMNKHLATSADHGGYNVQMSVRLHERGPRDVLLNC